MPEPEKRERGNPDFNAKIYNKVIILCGKGYALTYVQNAAEFDGVGAGRLLKSIISTYNLSQSATIHRTARHLPHPQFKPISKHYIVQHGN